MSNPIQIKRKFKSSIKRGTGEAILLMRNYPDIDFSDEIIEASLKNFAYDGQLESSRAPYIFEMISLSSEKELIKKAILEALTKPQQDTWSLTQLFYIAKLFAMQSDTEAKDAIYNGFLKNPDFSSNWAGSYEIIDSDGFEGLKFIAEKFGRDLQNDPEDWQDDTIINYFKDANPDLDVFEMLEEAASQNPFIKTYLDAVNENIYVRQNREKEVIVYENVVDEILSRKKFRFNKRSLTDAESDLIAQRLLKEQDKENIEKLLAVFGRFKFPLDNGFILKLARDNNKEIANLAINALKLLSSDGIREFTLSEVKDSPTPGNLIGILKSNYKPGDHKLLTNLVKKFRNENIIESLTSSITEIYRSVSTADCKEPLEAVYNKSNCGIHRKDVVEILIQNNVLSNTIRQEIEFDCNKEIRQLVN